MGNLGVVWRAPRGARDSSVGKYYGVSEETKQKNPLISTRSHSARSLLDTLTIIRLNASWERRGKTISSLIRPLLLTSVVGCDLS